MAQKTQENGASDPLDRLRSEATGLLEALGDRAMTSVKGAVEGATDRLTEYTSGSGASPGVKAVAAGAKNLAEGKSPGSSLLKAGTKAAKEKIAGMFGKGGGGGKSKKVTNIIESIDVGVPIKLAYDQWTRFTDFPSFMKKVESVEQAEDEKLNWKAQILWSHRTWESNILEQVPDDKIVWRSKGAKGYVDGAVTFHELAPTLTRVLVVLEYHPQGLFEHTGNIWRAQGRRVRLELKHFRRHLMSEAVLHSDEIEGWRGVISDGEVQQNGSQGNGKSKQAKQGRGSKSRKKNGGPESGGSGSRESAGNGTKSRRSSQASSQSNGRQTSGSRGSARSGSSSSSTRQGSRSSAKTAQSSSRTRKAS
jgi:uncharacterized membrane protein